MKDEFARRGVVFPVPVMEPNEASRVSSALFDYVARVGHQGTAKLDASPFDHPDHPLVKILMPVVKSRRFLNAVRPILGADILLKSVNVFSKPPTGVEGVNPTGPSQRGRRYPIEWHWDDPRPGADADNVLTAWLALTPSTVASGCVRYVEGSHRVAIPRANPLDRSQLQLNQDEWKLLDGLPIVDAILQPGQLAIHHSAVIHASAPNYAGHPRVGLAVRLYTPNSPHDVTGSRIGVLLSGQVVEGGDSQQLTGLQLRDVVNMSWWTGQKQDGETLTKENQLDHKVVNQKFQEHIAARIEEGDPLALYILARLTLVGLMGVPGDQKKAVTLIKAASELGYDRAIDFMRACDVREQSMVLQDLRMEWKGLSNLAILVKAGDLRGMTFLLDLGVPIDLRMRDGRQAVHVAAAGHGQRELSLLLEHGADVNSRTTENMTPLHIAAETGHPDTVTFLIDSGADLGAKNGSGQTPEMCAAPGLSKALFESA